MTTLSLSHQKFVQVYVSHANAARAYQAVYPEASMDSARKAGSRLLRQPEVAAEVERLRRLSESASVMDLAQKREFLARIIHDPGQKTADRLRALKLDAELAGEMGFRRAANDSEDAAGEIVQAIRHVTHAEAEAMG